MRTSFCKNCQQIGTLDIIYDSYACEKCNRWLEPKCANSSCEYCKDRPDKPLEENA